VRLHSFAPAGFEAYARVFHPAGSTDGGARWADLGAARGVSLSPDVGFSEVTGLGPGDPALDDLTPSEGALPQEPCSALARVLRRHTATPDSCWFCLWEGNGAFWSHAHTSLAADDASPAERERERDDARRQDDVLHGTPRVEAENRAYFLFHGPLEAACAFEPAGWYDSPNLWWPEDRAWIVVTEVDGYSTYVGAGAAAIGDVVGSDELEAIAVPHDVPTDPGPYPPRWRT
jgi:hypothetical protein